MCACVGSGVEPDKGEWLVAEVNLLVKWVKCGKMLTAK